MPPDRIRGTELARTLNSATRPVYVLDDDLTVVFCNRACLQWLGEAAEGLLGQRCGYHSGPETGGARAVAAGLCPPPAVLAGRQLTAEVTCICESRRGADGALPRRRATFIPLGSRAEDLLGVVAILETEDLAASEVDQARATPPERPEPEAGELHDLIRRFRQEAATRFRPDRMIGNSPAMRRARAQLELAAGSRARVLLVGPPGSGRQHAAAAIHYGSEAAGSLIPLACSTLGAELIRSTVRAIAAQFPLHGQRGQSTLLLNDVDQLPADVQGELASVFAATSFPLRLIATAEQPLPRLAREGRFCEDLAAGLSTITIELPPLAQRREDLPLLAQLFLEEANARGSKQLGGFTPEALDLLDAYGWPGNVDELARTVAEAHRHAGGYEIDVGDLPQRIHVALRAAARPPRPEETIVLDEFLRRVERELIRRAMARAKGNKAKAARLLGMTRPRLYRRLAQLGLEEDASD